MRHIFTIFLIMLFLPFAAHAQTQNEPELPPTLKQFTEQGAQAYFLGNFEGMNGWVLIRQGRPEYFYENKERTAIVMGLLFNKDGQMMTMSQLSDLKRRLGDDIYATTRKNPSQTDTGPISDNTAPATATDDTSANSDVNANIDSQPSQETVPDEQSSVEEDTSMATPLMAAAPTPAERMYVDLIQSKWFTINPEGTHDVFAFIDPDCVHCQQFIRDADSFVKKGNLRLRVIPVGMNEMSARRAAVLLASANPGERLIQYADGDKDALPAPASVNVDAINDNTALMVKNRFDVTPMIVYRTKKGAVRIIRGRPADYDNVLRDINEN